MSRYIPYASHFNETQGFYGGQSSDEAFGIAASSAYLRALEHRKNPSQLTVLPGPRTLNAGVVQDLILNILQVQNGTRYGYGDQGNIYKISTSNVVTYLNKLATGSDGCLYRSDSDAMYFATQTTLQRYYPISGSPTFDVTYGPSKSIDAAAYRTGGSATYTVPLAIDETQQCSFQPDIEPFYSNKVKVVAKGTGNVTLTLHDGLNNVLGSVTVSAANMNTGLQEFLYSSQIRGLVKPNARTYHFHLTSTVADTTIQCATANQLNTADFELWAYLLVDTVNNLHPMAQFLQYTLIGNGNYLAVWEPLSDSNPPNSELQRHRLVFPSGFEVYGIAVTDEFAVIACGKCSTNGTKDFQEGKLFIWDGVSQTYNQIVDVAAGCPEGIRTHENIPYFVVNGVLSAWPGGRDVTKVRTIANLTNTYTGVIDNTHTYPNMLTVKDGMLHVGYPSVTTNAAIEFGTYVWGSLDKNFAASFNYGYVPANMQVTNTGTTLQQGCVRNFGDEMYMSWKDASGNYGLDIIDNLCTPAPIFKFRMRRLDAGSPYRDKQAVKQAIAFDVLPNGTTITAVSKINNAAYISGLSSSANTERLVSPIDKPSLFKRIVTGFDGTCTGTTSPTIYSQVLEYKPLIEQTAI